jgi:hypothetical protein
MHKCTNFFLAALFVCGIWSNCPAETESVATEPDSTAADSGSDKVYTREYTGKVGDEKNYAACENLTGGEPVIDGVHVYAVPYAHYPDQSAKMFGVDQIWGGAHVTLGKVKQDHPVEHFGNIETWLTKSEATPKKAWNPSHEELNKFPEIHKTCESSHPKSYLAGYKLEFKSKNLDKIVNHIHAQSGKDKKYSWFEPEPNWKSGVEWIWHITAVQDPKFDPLQTREDLMKIVTDSTVPWSLAIIKVGEEGGKKYLERLHTVEIPNLKDTNFIPEPTTLLLALLALVAAPLRVRCG